MMLSTHHINSESQRIGSLQAFSGGTFSDITITALKKSYKLHRIVLLNSPYFRRRLLDQYEQKETSSNHGGVNIHLYLPLPPSKLLTEECLDFTLRDLYDVGGKLRHQEMRTDNVVGILVLSTFLEMSDLINYCINYIEISVKRENVLQFTQDLECLFHLLNIHPVSILKDVEGLEKIDLETLNPEQMFTQSLRLYYNKLFITILSYICLLATPDSLNSTHAPLIEEELLAKLSPMWLKSVLSSDFLVIESEFERYKSLKRILTFRQKTKSSEGPFEFHSSINETVNLASNSATSSKRRLIDSDDGDGDGDDHGDDVGPNPEDVKNNDISLPMTPKKQNQKSMERSILTPISRKISRLGGLIGFGTHSPRTSKIHSHDDKESTQEGSEKKNLMFGAETKSQELDIAHLFEKCIVFQFISFPDLVEIVRDGFLPKFFITENYFIQGALINHVPLCKIMESPKLGSFRFACRFGNLKDLLKVKNSSKKSTQHHQQIVTSHDVPCAGTLYRVMLRLGKMDQSSLEDRKEEYGTPAPNFEDESTLSESSSSARPTPRLGKDNSQNMIDKSSKDSSNHNNGKKMDSISVSNTENLTSCHREDPLYCYVYLQRNRNDPLPSPSTPCDIRYKLLAFDKNAFDRGDYSSKDYVRPVTQCEVNGEGFVRGIRIPKGDLWIVVNIEFNSLRFEQLPYI